MENLLDSLMKNNTHFRVENSFIGECKRHKLTEGQIIGRFFLRQLSNIIWEKYTEGAFLDEMGHYAKEVRQELLNYEITSFIYDPGTRKVIVTLCRPGLFIGVKGKNFEIIDSGLRTWAEENRIPYEGIKIVEDTCALQEDLLTSITTYAYSISDPDY